MKAAMPNSVLRIKAVIDRRLGMHLADKEVFVNVTGGLRINEPAVELAVAVSIAGSFKNREVSRKAVFLGDGRLQTNDRTRDQNWR